MRWQVLTTNQQVGIKAPPNLDSSEDCGSARNWRDLAFSVDDIFWIGSAPIESAVACAAREE